MVSLHFPFLPKVFDVAVFFYCYLPFYYLYVSYFVFKSVKSGNKSPDLTGIFRGRGVGAPGGTCPSLIFFF